jgi:small subunit ribosomal protein S29
MSTATEAKFEPKDNFRTSEDNPANHSLQNLGLYYTIPQAVKKTLFSHGGFPKSFEKQIKTFGEPCLMIREPAIEIINYIKNSDFTKPVNRFVLYGRDGAGKSLALSHILHYGYISEYILVHVPWASNWFKRPKETGNSSSKEGFIDIPLDAAAWLIHFKNQNQNILAKLNLTTSVDYVWSKRETTPAGSTFLELIDHGVNRVKFASDTIAALLSELKKSSTSGKCKTMVAIDGFNAFFHPNTRIFGENKTKIRADQITLTAPFLDITNYNWTNGVVILTVDRIAMTEERMESELPRYLLGKQGFEHLDPFVPVRVDNYTDKEYIRCIEYYLNRKWILNTKPGFDDELKFLTGKNPFKLMEVCASL